uniref:Uncharacterized protein n=1 Tax=Glossina pallidipes TaxID=7398 RepID=A0A1A9ZIB1_GLOPL
MYECFRDVSLSSAVLQFCSSAVLRWSRLSSAAKSQLKLQAGEFQGVVVYRDIVAGDESRFYLNSSANNRRLNPLGIDSELCDFVYIGFALQNVVILWGILLISVSVFISALQLECEALSSLN